MNNKLTDTQYALQKKAIKDTALADKWLRDNGVNVQTIAQTHGTLVQAQKKAHELLTQHTNILTPSQIKKLQGFQRKMNTGHIRKKLKPNSGHVVFNINTKIVRILHKKAKAQAN
jgi:hypothetical protein